MGNYQNAEDMTVVVEWSQFSKTWEAVSVVDEDNVVAENTNRNLCIVEAQRKGYRVELKSRSDNSQRNIAARKETKQHSSLGKMPRMSDD